VNEGLALSTHRSYPVQYVAQPEFAGVIVLTAERDADHMAFLFARASLSGVANRRNTWKSSWNI
jgi:hypothetical protein